MKRLAFLFPGQGAQYIGMGKDFYSTYPIAKQVFEQADDVLQTNLSRLIFSGDEKDLTQTKNSQPAIFIMSYALLSVLRELFGKTAPFACAGLSLGEYSALVASGHISFQNALVLVKNRATFMHEACEEHKGTMAVVLGMSDAAVQEAVGSLQMPDDIWAANFNCPGQVVISGTERGIQAASKLLLEQGAKRILPLQVHGAFHSGLMKQAQDKLKSHIMQTPIHESSCFVAMNCTGAFHSSSDEIRHNLIEQVVQPVYWHKSIAAMSTKGVEHFVEIGPGKTLAGMNKRMNVTAPTFSLEKIEDLAQLERIL